MSTKRHVSPTENVENLEWKWSCFDKGEFVSKVRMWTSGNSIEQVELTGSRGTILSPIERESCRNREPTSELKSDTGFSTLQISTAPKYAWKLFLAGVEVYDLALFPKRKPSLASNPPANVFRLFTPQGCRISGLGFGYRSGMLLGVGCDQTQASAVVNDKVEVACLAPSKSNLIDVTAESVLFLTDSVVVISLALACLLVVYFWLARGKKCS